MERHWLYAQTHSHSEPGPGTKTRVKVNLLVDQSASNKARIRGPCCISGLAKSARRSVIVFEESDDGAATESGESDPAHHVAAPPGQLGFEALLVAEHGQPGR